MVRRTHRTFGGRRVYRAVTSLALFAGLLVGGGSAQAASIDPGPPPFTGAANPVPAEPAAFDPSKSMLKAIYDADVAAGGTSYWFDRVLARPFLNNSDSSLFTRGRALFMYTHQPRTLGFAGSGTGANGGGGYAYRQVPDSSRVTNLYTIDVSGDALTEDTAKRVQYPSYYSAVFNRDGLSVAEKKFITYNDVAVTDLTLTNTGDSSQDVTLTAASPIATTPDGDEMTGTVKLRYGLSTIFPRMSGDGFKAGEANLTRDVTVDPGKSVSLKVQLGAIAKEIPESAADYQRYRGLDPNTAWLTQMREYNKFWVDTVPYVDLPDQNVKKMSYYRTWENRFNLFDGNIPGNDYQFPVDLEGALGYNNQISLTVPMRMQDLQFWRDPLYSYGPALSQGEESGCHGFIDNPGNTGNWNRRFEQWTASQAWQSYLVHGGPKPVVNQLAKYAECDVKGTLAQIDTNKDNLIEYDNGTPAGNDADSVAFKYFGTGQPQDRTESSFWYAGARAAAAEYATVGNDAKAKEMNGIADGIQKSILTNLWASGPVTNAPTGGGGTATGPRVPGKIGNAIKLSGSNDFVDLPDGIVKDTNDFTISAWVNPSQDRTWSRIFDIGNDTGTYMFLTNNAGGAGLRYAITTSGGGAEQQLTGGGHLPLNTWSHVAVTLSGNTGTLYLNGQPVATNNNMTLHPSSLGATRNNWIGRSQFSDPLLAGSVDDFQIYDHALSAGEIGSLAGGQPGAGNVASYKFDEDGGATVTDSSGAGHDATAVTLTKPTITCPGKVFLQKDLATGNLVCWKDQQNFAPFIDHVAPDTDEFKQALRYYADPAEFPLFPTFTADQADQQANNACEACNHGSNNFSNINETLQARLFSTAIRDYPSTFITPQMYRRMIEWLSWNEYIGGDNRFPDNNEFFFNWDPGTKTLGRSGIHHDVLGSFNWMIFQDIAGLQARADQTVELSPIDMGYDHFAVNNLSYHGSDLTIVWQKPGGKTYYPLAPAGYSLYVNGKRAFTVDRLTRVRWNSDTGAVETDGNVSFHGGAPLAAADKVDLSGNARMVDAFGKAGVDVSKANPPADNLALGKKATASFTTTSPAAQATSPDNAVDGSTISGLPVTSGSFVGTNPIWGDLGSPNSQDWLAVDLGTPRRLDDVKLFFYSNKEFGSGGNTYREPASYTVQYWNGSSWVDVPGQARNPGAPAPNLNDVRFSPVTASKVRVVMDRAPGFAVGVKEFQVLPG